MREDEEEDAAPERVASGRAQGGWAAVGRHGRELELEILETWSSIPE